MLQFKEDAKNEAEWAKMANTVRADILAVSEAVQYRATFWPASAFKGTTSDSCTVSSQQKDTFKQGS